MLRTADQPRAPISLDAIAAQLDDLLTELTGTYGRLLGAMDGHTEAVRRADGAAIAAGTQVQAELVTRISELERRRRKLVSDASVVITFPPLGRAVTLTDLATHLPHQSSQAMQHKARALKELIGQVHARQTMLRNAAGALLAHIEGVVRQVGRQLSRAGTYSPRGRVDGALVAGGIDLKT